VTSTMPTKSHGDLLYRPAASGDRFIGPGDVYRFLVTGAESGGAYFAINVPRGIVHRFHNSGTTPTRMVLTFSPANIEHFFEETLERALDPAEPALDNLDEVAARYALAAPRYGIEFVD